MMKWMLSICALLFLVTGCQSQHEEKQVMKQDPAVPVMQQAQSEMKQQGFLKYKVQGSSVYIESTLQDFHLEPTRLKKDEKAGYFTVYVDGKRAGNEYTAAFVVKHLSKGKHKMTVVLNSRHPEYRQKRETWDVFVT
ncbi:hypothetical protein [Bacillus pumilus]|uniref:hypothetical protein n=2 Tax=Bacillaceae TaxID=186817 RepID=UPI00227DC766|nr:hypothetical protein [Bacillus pumilus]MCY7540956.1 hypothetical protein [Bacillus pumilus]MDX5486766.1 hypothetical protein [Bacillus pumilus]WHX46414.1 hypothetical protein QNH35_08035 [Bacillus pumilus]